MAFFPRYSVVNKSWKGEKGEKRQEQSQSSRSSKAKIKKQGKEELEHNKKMKTEHTIVKSTKEEVINKQTVGHNIVNNNNSSNNKSNVKVGHSNLSKSSLYEIISTMKMKASSKSNQNKPEEKKSDPHQTSFYYQGGNVSSASSKYDLTIARNNSNVQAEVHQPNYVTLRKERQLDIDANDKMKSSSPQPLLSEGENSDKIYSFNTLREKCRKMIANSKPFQNKTKL